MTLNPVPELLTVPEAAELLRISRTTAYAEARRYEQTGKGLPVIRIGHSLRAPRKLLDQLISGERSWGTAADPEEIPAVITSILDARVRA